jgi:hypothetical protein
MNDKMSEQYFFSNDLMYRDSIDYYLYGIINYRDHLNVIGDGLNDTIFINQSNNLAYWSQTFKFTAINMKTTKHIEAPIINSSYHAKTVDFKVFPNPVTKNSTLAIDTDNGEQYTLTIFDVHGVILHACILVDRMNIGNILTASGIYFYTITHNGTLITSGKLIKE